MSRKGSTSLSDQDTIITQLPASVSLVVPAAPTTNDLHFDTETFASIGSF